MKKLKKLGSQVSVKVSNTKVYKVKPKKPLGARVQQLKKPVTKPSLIKITVPVIKKKLTKKVATTNDSEDENTHDTEDAVESEEVGETSDDGDSLEPPYTGAAAAKRKAAVKTTTANGLSPTGNKMKNPTGLTSRVKAPTLAEINELKDTRNLFHSNLFRLQVKEMLAELAVKPKHLRYIETWLENFQQFLRSLPERTDDEDGTHLSNSQPSWLTESGLQLPLALTELHIRHQPPPKSFRFQFIRPKKEAFLIGAAATQTLLAETIIASTDDLAITGGGAHQQLVVDVCVPMPAECFQKDNHLNTVYDQKRALYLTFLAAQMLSSREHYAALKRDQLRFVYHANNPLKPVLEYLPPAGTGGVCMRLYVAAEETTFKLNRFVPWNSNIRATLFSNCIEVDDGDTLPLATPTYNAQILFDLTAWRNVALLRDIFAANANYRDGLLLLKVWLRQRQLHIGYSGFSAYHLAACVGLLHRQRRLQPGMSSYQVARTVWTLLAYSAWDEDQKGVSLHIDGGGNDDSSGKRPTLEQFHAHYEVVFIDATGYNNLCAQMPGEMYRRVRTEARRAVALLNDARRDSFQALFMTRQPLYAEMDHVLKINQRMVIAQLLERHSTSALKLDAVGHAYPQLLKLVTQLLRRGLGRRAVSVLPLESNSTAQLAVRGWRVDAKAPTCGDYLHVGLVLHPEHALEVLDKGPESMAPDAEEFRRFWGERSQLRRFQDGTITEAVLWGSVTDTPQQRRLIVRELVLYLLQIHFELTVDAVEYVGGECESLYRLSAAFRLDGIGERFPGGLVSPNSDAESLALRAIRAFDELTRQLRELRDLPLEITSIGGVSPVMRYCEPSPVLPRARCIGERMHALHVLHVVIQLGQSGKWPSELDALRALKVAFCLQIAQMLRDKFHLHTQVMKDGTVMVLKHGYCFALELAHAKEVVLLRQQKVEESGAGGVGVTTTVKYVDCPASVALEWRHTVMPQVTGALHALHQQQPCYGPTVMVAKRWLYSQLIDCELWPDECTELLIASQFLRLTGGGGGGVGSGADDPAAAASATGTICSPQRGFIRFLQLLSHTDWQSELCCVDFNNAMDGLAFNDLEHRFHTERDTFPPLCIATAYDQRHAGHLWTNTSQPNVFVLARVTMLARRTLAIIENTLLSSTERFVRPAHIFKASSEGYHLVIQLKPDLVPNTLALEVGSPFVALTKPNWRLPVAGTNLLRDAVQKLRQAYSNYAAFFYNPCGGKEIAVVWKPHICEERDFKVMEVSGSSLSDDGKKVKCRLETFVEDFKFILADFYLRIETVAAIRQISEIDQQGHKNKYNKPANVMRGGQAKIRYFNAGVTASPIAAKKQSRATKEADTVSLETSAKTNNKRRALKGPAPGGGTKANATNGIPMKSKKKQFQQNR